MRTACLIVNHMICPRGGWGGCRGEVPVYWGQMHHGKWSDGIPVDRETDRKDWKHYLPTIHWRAVNQSEVRALPAGWRYMINSTQSLNHFCHISAICLFHKYTTESIGPLWRRRIWLAAEDPLSSQSDSLHHSGPFLPIFDLLPN